MLASPVAVVLTAHFVFPQAVRPDPVALGSTSAAPTAAALVAATTGLRAVAERDPERLALMSLERLEGVRDYTCVFLKQEELGGRLSPVQEIEVAYRAEPVSVYMKWLKNADECRRALYVRGTHIQNGQELALVEPAGVIARLFVSETLIPIHGERSRKASRRTIDDFGFKSTLDLLVRFNDLARARGVLDISFAGEGVVDGRPTLIIRRFLPYAGPNGGFPDARMDLHFDCEWLLPVAVYSWADRDGKRLLGSYVYTRVRINPGLTDDAFRF